MSKASSKGRTVVGAYGGCKQVGVELSDSPGYKQQTTTLNTGTKSASVGGGRAGYETNVTTLKTGTKS